MSGDTAYLYRVRAVDGNGFLSPESNPALGTAIAFTDSPLSAGVTTVKAQHLGEVRRAVNAVRQLAGLGAGVWTDAEPAGAVIRATHVRELRERLQEALTALGLPTVQYTDAVLTAGVTVVRAAHIEELRQRASRASGAAVGGGTTPGAAVPMDGHAYLSFDSATNRINSPGWEYDAAGNQTRALSPFGAWQRYEYDAANRLVRVKADDNQTIYASYAYGSSNERLVSDEGGTRTYYASEGGTVLAEYVEYGAQTTPQWTKSYVYLGGRLLSTFTPTTNGEAVQHHHPDRLGTRLVTDPANGTSFEQATLPFGNGLPSESSGATNRRFTSYDRSTATGLDYAVNRRYDPMQGRFTQVDPIGMKSVKLIDPQTLNLYAYCANDPVNHTDPDGLGFFSFFKKLFKGIGKVFSAVGAAVASVLNNKWVRIGFFVASFIIPFVGPALAKILSTAVKIYNTIADIGAQLQLYGQLLQGKFKELGISVGLGIVGSFIGMVEDAVVSGIQTSLLRGTNVLRGAIQGFKEGFSRLSANLIGRSLKNMFIPAYGIYGGPGNPPDDAYDPSTGQFDPDLPGVDAIDDKGFKNHDLAYRNRQKTPVSLRNADVRLVRTLLANAPRVRIIDIAFGGRPASGSVFKFFAVNYFTGSAVVRSARL